MYWEQTLFFLSTISAKRSNVTCIVKFETLFFLTHTLIFAFFFLLQPLARMSVMTRAYPLTASALESTSYWEARSFLHVMKASSKRTAQNPSLALFRTATWYGTRLCPDVKVGPILMLLLEENKISCLIFATLLLSYVVFEIKEGSEYFSATFLYKLPAEDV